MPNYVDMFVSALPKYSVSLFIGYLKEKNTLILFDKHAIIKDKFGNIHFWS
ncbi:MAG: transposase [Lachnospiraceae bacterium]|nr:transposase [Lachnospiraceae bacterium]